MIYLFHMKKKLLLLVLSAALLGGCDFNINSLKFWESKNNDNSQENQENSGENESEHHEEENHEEEEHHEEEHKEDLQEYTATLETHGLYFNTNFSEGTNLTSASQSKVDELRTYLENPLEYENLFTSLTCEYCTTRKVDGDTYLQIGTGSYAKGKFNEGSFKYGSKEKIYRVEVTAFNYSNPYQDYSTGALVPNVDTEAHLLLDDIDLSLELPSTSNPVEKSVVKEYENGVNSFTLKTTSGRVLIKSITITWRG